jgi:hypothetical protein
MVQYKDIHKEVINITNYLIIALILAFICIVSYFISKMIEIPIKYISFAITALMTSFFLYRGATPLFIEYQDFILNISKSYRISVANLKKEQAKYKDIESELQFLQGLYKEQQAKFDNLQANEKQSQKIISELQQENSELRASETNELATVKQELSKAKQYLESMSKELLAKTNKLNALQQTEKYMFLAKLQLTPEQVRKGLINTVNGLMNGKTDEQKENIRNIFNS